MLHVEIFWHWSLANNVTNKVVPVNTNSSLVQPGSIRFSVGYARLPVNTNIKCSFGYWFMTDLVHETSCHPTKHVNLTFQDKFSGSVKLRMCPSYILLLIARTQE